MPNPSLPMHFLASSLNLACIQHLPLVGVGVDVRGVATLFTSQELERFDASTILSASNASSSMSVLAEAERIFRTSGGIYATNNALKRVFRSTFRFCICCRRADGLRSPKPFKLRSS